MNYCYFIGLKYYIHIHISRTYSQQALVKISEMLNSNTKLYISSYTSSKKIKLLNKT